MIDPRSGGHRSLLADPGFTDLVVLTAGVEDLAPLRLNPQDASAEWRGLAEPAGDLTWHSGVADTLFDAQSSVPVDQLTERPAVVELGGLPNHSDRALAAALLIARVASVEHPYVVVLERAHELIDAAAGPLLRKARRHVGLLVVGDPTRLTPALFEREHAAVLLSPGQVEVSVPGESVIQVAIEPEPGTSETVTDDMVRRRFRRLADRHAWGPSLAPYPECAGCRFQCELRAGTLQAVRGSDTARFLTVLSGLPAADPIGAVGWWRDLHEHLAPYGPLSNDRSRANDELVCRLIHLHRTTTGAAASFWARGYRRYAGR